MNFSEKDEGRGEEREIGEEVEVEGDTQAGNGDVPGGQTDGQTEW